MQLLSFIYVRSNICFNDVAIAFDILFLPQRWESNRATNSSVVTDSFEFSCPDCQLSYTQPKASDLLDAWSFASCPNRA